MHDLRGVLADHTRSGSTSSPELPLVSVDPQLFHHCLINLLENAGKYGAPGTPIGIVARRHMGGITLSVLDEGPGLPPRGREADLRDLHAAGGIGPQGRDGPGPGHRQGLRRGRWGWASKRSNRDDPSGACFTIRFPDALVMKGTAGI
ncbi:MAG: ATP-binding protein [Sphingomonas sp.]